MSDATISKAAVSAPAAPAEVTPRDLATIAAGCSRFLARLSRMPAFQDAKFGLAEWSALSTLAERNGINSRQLAEILGVTAQRVNQITDSLRVLELISLTPAPQDARVKIITITPAGWKSLQEIDKKLQPIIEAALGDRVVALRRAKHMITKTLMRIFAVKPPGAK